MMRKILELNPELARNIWQEFNLQRIILMPLVIGLISALVFTYGGFTTENISTLHNVSLIMFLAITTLWGIRSASGALLDEQQNQTWDWQRMSGLSPWKLTIGKLFGGTAYNWYGGLMCILLYLITLPAGNPGNDIAILFTAIVFTVMIHGLVMLVITTQMSKPYSGRSKLRGFLVYMAITGLIFYSLIYLQVENDVPINMNWYGIQGDLPVMALLIAIFYCTWTIAGLYRSMRSELQYNDPPVWWITFLLSNLVFQFGFIIFLPEIPEGNKWMILMLMALMQYLAGTYTAALTDQRDIVSWKKWIYATDAQLRFLETPIWLISLVFAFVAGMVFAVLNATTENTFWPATEDIFRDGHGWLFLFLLSVFGFVIRDMGILLLLNFSLRREKAATYFILYLTILYGLLPVLTRDLGAGMIFYPDITTHPFLMFLFPVLEAMVIATMVKRKISAAQEQSPV